jgi:hypothetical protein
MYLASIGMCLNFLWAGDDVFANVSDPATGIVTFYNYMQSKSSGYPKNLVLDISTSYYSVSLALNVLLTLMISVRLILHRRSIRNVMGDSFRACGLYKNIVTILIESYAPYAIVLLLTIVPRGINTSISFFFSPVVSEIQVCAVL